MANTTCAKLITLCASDADGVIAEIKREAEVTFLEDTDPAGCALSSFSLSVRCIGDDRLKALISAFQNYAYDSPAYATLILCDDNSERFDGVYSPT